MHFPPPLNAFNNFVCQNKTTKETKSYTLSAGIQKSTLTSNSLFTQKLGIGWIYSLTVLFYFTFS